MLDWITRRFRSRLGRDYTIGEIGGAYNEVFRSPAAAQFVLPDLVEFCHAAEPAPKECDLGTQMRAAGRRDVWLHIQEHLHLKPEELYALYVNRSTLMRQE